ncbi:hypothetical protein C7M84_000156 [Penaeus vannamei]|uniref:Sodium-coupled monocarboxylate transporter 1 n=1 Tax=Penaeus vannamei TaxID=6689 RepID=A0A3R7PSD5_PENVA|nr:hypothetical protein C7M84_000156 [Penaeus vannamei]
MRIFPSPLLLLPFSSPVPSFPSQSPLLIALPGSPRPLRGCPSPSPLPVRGEALGGSPLLPLSSPLLPLLHFLLAYPALLFLFHGFAAPACVSQAAVLCPPPLALFRSLSVLLSLSAWLSFPVLLDPSLCLPVPLSLLSPRPSSPLLVAVPRALGLLVPLSHLSAERSALQPILRPPWLSRFSTVDYAIFVLLLLASLLVGTLSGWRSGKRDAKDFLTGGRSMNPVAVVLSLLGGVVSALSVLGNATEIYLYGTQLWMNLLGCIYGAAFVITVLLPVFYPLGLATMNEILQLRFDSTIEEAGSMTQLVTAVLFGHLSVRALAHPQFRHQTAHGGVRAVVYTDVLQTTVMFVGVLAVVMQVCVDLGGLDEVWSRAVEGNRIDFFNFDPNPLVRHTFWSVQVLGLYFFVSTIGISQPQYQRLVSVKTLRISQMQRPDREAGPDPRLPRRRQTPPPAWDDRGVRGCCGRRRAEVRRPSGRGSEGAWLGLGHLAVLGVTSISSWVTWVSPANAPNSVLFTWLAVFLSDAESNRYSPKAPSATRTGITWLRRRRLEACTPAPNFSSHSTADGLPLPSNSGISLTSKDCSMLSR